jgi:VWFA-related protein
MGTVAVKYASHWAAYQRLVRLVSALALWTGLACAAAWFAPPCQAQSTAPQNNTTPPATTDDPPPSLIKHPKPAPAPAAEPTTPPAPQSSSTPAPPAQTPAAQPDAAPGTTPPLASSSAAPSAAQNPAPGPSTTQSPAQPTTAPSASPTSAGDTSTNAVQSSNSGQSSTGAQSPAPQAAATSAASPASVVPASDAAASAPEINTRTTTVPLESRANLVPVRVVVHDSTGQAVENLRKDDFQIKQDGQLQFITHFSVEMAGSTDNQVARGEAIPLPTDSASVTESAPDASGKPVAAAPGALTMPTRFVALLFDDVHLDVGDVARTRTAAMRFIETTVKPNERLAIYTISGQHQVDFTDDRSAIRASLVALMANPVGAYDPKTQQDCLQMSYYEADLIENKGDQQAAAAALSDAMACEASMPGGSPQTDAAQARVLVASTVQMAIQAGYINSQYAVQRLQEVVRRVSALPGQRSIVLVSPGFLMSTLEYEVSEIIDKANHANVYINTLDARGLYTVDPIGDVTRRPQPHSDAATMAIDLQYRLEEQQVQSDVLSDLAYSTGGFYFRNNNDLDAGFRVTAAEPEVSYLLAFVPSNLKNDGKFHTVSVKLTTKEKYTVQARRGFFAPKRGETPEQLAKQDIEDALFSQEEQQSVPIQLHLQYFKSDAQNAKLSVLTHVDLNHVGFEKSQGRNWDDLTIVAALFDRNGNFITGEEKTLELRLKDATLVRLDQTGVTVKTNFDVKPGGYLVRLVVRDSKAAQLSARNGVVEIP